MNDAATNTSGSAESTEKAELLNTLKIDRSAPERNGRPLLWFVLIALIGGGGGALWLFWPMLSTSLAEPVAVSAFTVRAANSPQANTSVLDATGYVVARRQATVSSKTTGKVIEVLIEEGLVVKEGQLLARLDDSVPRAQFELARSQTGAARASLAELDVSRQQAQLDYGRTQGLAERNLASQADLDRDRLAVEALDARIARAQEEITVAERGLAVQEQMLADMMIRAPFDGVVVAKAAQPGEMISPVSAGGGFTRTGICTLVDMNSLEVEVDVNEAYINRVQPAQRADVTLNAYPGEAYPAEVIAIIPAADRNKATVRVRIGFIERDDRVLPDMGVRVAFLEEEKAVAATDDAPRGVLVPRRAVATEEGERFVYLIRNDVVQRRTVRTAGVEGDNVRVLTGLRGGDRVVARLDGPALDALSDGAPVSVN